jgi:hypothetical protein
LQFFDPEKFPIPGTASSLVLIFLGAFQKHRTSNYFKKLGFSKYPELAAIFLILKMKQLPHTQGLDSSN